MRADGRIASPMGAETRLIRLAIQNALSVPFAALRFGLTSTRSDRAVVLRGFPDHPVHPHGGTRAENFKKYGRTGCISMVCLVYLGERSEQCVDMPREPNRASEDVLNRLIEKYQGALLRLCYAYLRDRSLAEDALQETFLKAYRSLDGFRSEASEKTWLMKIAMNTCRDFRRSGWFVHMDRTMTPDRLPEPSVAASDQDREITMEVMHLPIKLREVVLLCYYQNLTTVEAAQTLGISQQAVSARLTRARAKLFDVLEGGSSDENQ